VITNESSDESFTVVESKALPERLLRLRARMFTEWKQHNVEHSKQSFGPPYSKDGDLANDFLIEVSNKHPSLKIIREYLLEFKADPNTFNRNDNNNTGLHYAAFHDNLGLAKLLLHSKAHLIRRNATGATPIIVASQTTAKKGRIKVLSYLLKRGAPTNSFDISGRTALHHAILARNAGAVKVLMRYGASIHEVAPVDGTTNPEASENLFELAKMVSNFDKNEFHFATNDRDKQLAKNLRSQSKKVVSILKRAMEGKIKIKQPTNTNMDTFSSSLSKTWRESERYSADESIYLDAHS
jgi:ankyrin repeat protein